MRIDYEQYRRYRVKTTVGLPALHSFSSDGILRRSLGRTYFLVRDVESFADIWYYIRRLMAHYAGKISIDSFQVE